MTHSPSKCRERGFSLLELLIVVAITMVVAAVAVPNIWNSLQGFRLRTTASDLSGLTQKCRMMSVSQNKYYRVRGASTGGFWYAWVDMDNNFAMSTSEKVNSLELARGVAFDSSGGGLSLSSMSLGFTPVIGLPVFTPRGLPCIMISGACTATGQGYIVYLRQDRSLGGTGWAAVTVSPAGRVRAWSWNGSAWQ